MREYRIAAIPGDGIGVEVIAAGFRVLEVLPGIRSPLRNGEAIDWVIIRENSGGLPLLQ